MGSSNMKVRRRANRQKRTQSLWLILTLCGFLLLATAFIELRGNQNQGTNAPIAVKGAPSLQVDKEKVDLGDVKLGQTVQVKFKVTNVGDQPLRFTKEPFVEVVQGC